MACHLAGQEVTVGVIVWHVHIQMLMSGQADHRTKSMK